MFNLLLILLGKTISVFSSKLNLGSGATWPGHIALKLNKNFIRQTIDPKTKVVLVAGTNGKTTTATLINHILKQSKFDVAHNKTGANQLNGVASAIINDLPFFSSKLKKDYLVLEVDENSLPLILKDLTPNIIICLNLFRDQLDRYGEIDSIISRWRSSFEHLTKETTLILNADDPQVAFLGKKLKVQTKYFGLNENLQKEIEHGADSIYCPNCQSKLKYKSIIFSHLGDWSCLNCGLKRPKTDISNFKIHPLLGTYNNYNTLAAVLFAQTQKIERGKIEKALSSFKPAFGRQEEFEVKGRKVKIFLSKNPTSFNESLSTINSLNPKNILIVLNDRVVDGTDVSWIWDTKAEEIVSNFSNVVVSGDRCFDMALRLKYAISSQFKISNLKFKIEPDLKIATNLALQQTKPNQALYILPTYSAMLDVRKILKGRSIL